MADFPWGVITGLGVVLAGTAWAIGYILYLAATE